MSHNMIGRTSASTELAALRAEVAKLEKERDEARKALKEYGRHHATCNIWRVGGIKVEGVKVCDCGFADALARASQPTPAYIGKEETK